MVSNRYRSLKSYIKKVIMKDNKLYTPKCIKGRKCLIDLLFNNDEVKQKYIELGGNPDKVYSLDICVKMKKRNYRV